MATSEIPLDRSLLPPGSRVLCAVSGGADSVCLLHLVRALPDLECLAAHYDHGLREESARDAAFVASLCRDWGVPLYTERGDAAAYARQTRQSVETAARELRYDFLRRAADEAGADLIATAHNLNDNAETVLFHLARGAGLRGLAGIPERRENIVRPLLGVTRAQIEDYLAERGLPHVEDATNARDDYARNYARHHVLPAMERLHPGATANIARMARTVSEDEAYLAGLARDWLAGQTPGELSASGLLSLPRPVARRVLREWLGSDLSAERTGAILALCRAGPSAALDLPGRRLRRRNDALTLAAEDHSPLPERSIGPGMRVALPEAGLVCECRVCTPDEEVQISFNTFCFSYANICGKLSLTARREGDTLTLPGRKGTRSLKKLFIERKVPRGVRESVPVLRDEAGILGVYGIGQADRARIVPGEAFIKISFQSK